MGIKLIPACRFLFIGCMVFALNQSNPTGIGLKTIITPEGSKTDIFSWMMSHWYTLITGIFWDNCHNFHANWSPRLSNWDDCPFRVSLVVNLRLNVWLTQKCRRKKQHVNIWTQRMIQKQYNLIEARTHLICWKKIKQDSRQFV